MLRFGVVVLGVTDRPRAEEFWCAALGYRVRDDGFAGWARVLEPPGGTGAMIALQLSETPPDDHPRHHLDLHVADAAQQLRPRRVQRLVAVQPRIGLQLVEDREPGLRAGGERDRDGAVDRDHRRRIEPR